MQCFYLFLVIFRKVLIIDENKGENCVYACEGQRKMDRAFLIKFFLSVISLLYDQEQKIKPISESVWINVSPRDTDRPVIGDY